MTIPVKVRGGALATCSSCGSEHMPPVPCGLTFAQRLGSQRIDKGWMPAKREVGNLKNYYDSQALGAAFGEEAHEQMMEETKGFGPVTAENLEQARKEPELAEMIDAFYGQAGDVEATDDDPFADVTGDIGLGPVLAREPE